MPYWTVDEVFCNVNLKNSRCATISANVLGIAEGGVFQHKSSIKKRKLNLVQMPNRRRSAPLLAIPCRQKLFLLLVSKIAKRKSKKQNERFENRLNEKFLHPLIE